MGGKASLLREQPNEANYKVFEKRDSFEFTDYKNKTLPQKNKARPAYMNKLTIRISTGTNNTFYNSSSIRPTTTGEG